MKDEYPFLYHWKQQGFDKFPQIPFNVIEKSLSIEIVKRFIESVRESHPDLYEILTEKKPNNEDYEQVIKPIAEKFAQIEQKVIREEWFMADWGQQIWELGTKALAARESIVQGHDRKRVINLFCKQAFPKLQGGASIVTPRQKEILKRIYLELKDCIKYVRRQSEIPLTRQNGFSWNEDQSEYIKESVPDIEDLFADQELSFFTRYPSVAKTAYNIMARRLRPAISSNISASTLEDNLRGIKPPSFLLFR